MDRYNFDFGYKAAIFDFDGTIIDSMGFWADLAPSYFEKYGLPRPDFVNENFYKLKLCDSARLIQKECFPEFEGDRVFEEWKAEADYNYGHVLPPKPNAEKFLRELKARGIGLCIATLTDKHHIEMVLRRFGWEDIFDFTLTVAEVGKTKDYPDIYLECAKRFSLTPQECCVFEDTPSALETVKNADFGYMFVIDSAWKARGVTTTYEPSFYDYSELLDGTVKFSK